jgi:hypothetical protein
VATICRSTTTRSGLLKERIRMTGANIFTIAWFVAVVYCAISTAYVALDYYRITRKRKPHNNQFIYRDYAICDGSEQ